MNDSRYKWILYVIVFVILGTISIQVYWNYNSYLLNKQQLINDVKQSLNNSVETYFANIAEESTIAYTIESDSSEAFFNKNSKLDSILHKVDRSNPKLKTPDRLNVKLVEDVSILKDLGKDTIIGIIQNSNNKKTWKTKEISINQYKHFNFDSILNIQDFKTLTSRVIISMASDSIQLKSIDTLFAQELQNKELNLNYGLSFKTSIDKAQHIHFNNIKTTSLNAVSNSTYLPRNSELKVYFNNVTKTVLKRSLIGILLSTLLVLSVIGCLFYLLKIIKHQKQLAEIKNDLISNITHEFKTPIATIGVALESIKDFNVIDDKEKTKKYLEMSNGQLSKLNTMVEKLLETATLDSDSLNLNKEKINIYDLLDSIINKHQMQIENKKIGFISVSENVLAHVDIFHFENAINNIVDNAIKYGGNNISINLDQNSFAFTVSVSDDGNTITKPYKDKIFEKFYRIPKGNTHNVKGFGIGLYYTKKIVEKHDGAIHLDLSNNQTTFKITLPNE